MSPHQHESDTPITEDNSKVVEVVCREPGRKIIYDFYSTILVHCDSCPHSSLGKIYLFFGFLQEFTFLQFSAVWMRRAHLCRTLICSCGLLSSVNFKTFSAILFQNFFSILSHFSWYYNYTYVMLSGTVSQRFCMHLFYKITFLLVFWLVELLPTTLQAQMNELISG